MGGAGCIAKSKSTQPAPHSRRRPRTAAGTAAVAVADSAAIAAVLYNLHILGELISKQ